MKRKLLFVLCLILTLSNVFSQEELKIQLSNSETNEPVSYATVRFKGSSRGLIADYYGQFRIPYKDLDSVPNLLISSLGFKSIEINPKELKSEVISIVKMVPQIETLETIILNASNNDKKNASELSSIVKNGKKMLAKEIVVKAIKLIPKNLSNNHHSTVGYYRDYQIVNNEYYNLNEAILEQFDKGITSHKTLERYNQGAFYSFKQNRNFQIDTVLAKAYNEASKFIENATIEAFGGNELTILNIHNPIRNYNRKSFSYVYQLNEDFVVNHVFNKKDIQFIDDEPIVNISFTTRKRKMKKHFNHIQDNAAQKISNLHDVDGIISISLLDFSIHDFSYTMYDSNKLNPLFNVKIEYRRYEDKMYLNYITFNNRFIIEEGQDVFREISAFYDKELNAFEVKFNNEIDKSTIKTKNFKVRYKGRQAFIKDVEIVSSRVVRINIAEFDDLLTNVYPNDMADIDFRIRKIKDVNGAKIYKRRRVVAYQFREFFVQEVFHDKKLNKNLSFISKVRPLFKAPLNKELDVGSYIINSPLEKRRLKPGINTQL
ncbi:peptidase associated/transthyretin-like domain-containing protein [Winogradskyella jejuensis]|uniref:CarboxypepD_reg-like domain-containing protein n=1 Tax=Winogradskyella jejuensis TaxID=1089305 RepID=A0A1M5JXP8_9FLAO|nr:hypothetical protein [Winogradskyella jejuensis]SHG45314.1 hypothetical protein SAMN05444148_0173 [Winogradskyella jejuensis]